MIIPMYKYSFLVFYADYDAFIEQLKRKGVAHIRQYKAEPSREMQELYRDIHDVHKVVKFLESRKPKSQTTLSGENEKNKTGKEVFETISTYQRDLEQYEQQLQALLKEKKQITPWGYFSRSKVQRLLEEGFHIHFFVCPVKKYQPQWEEKYPIEVVSDHAGFRYFVSISRTEKPEIAIKNRAVDEVAPPGKELGTVEKEEKKSRERIREINEALDHLSQEGLEQVEQYKKELEDAYAELNVRFQTREEAEGKVRYLEAWVPEVKQDALDEFLNHKEVYYLKEKAKEEEKPPIMLKNNRYSRLFEPVGKLFSLPSYAELDMTPFFAPFFMMFFGFCLGDAGYGLMMVIAAALYKRKAKPGLKPVLALIQWLGLATVIFGILTGTFFGINLIETPIPVLSGIREMFLDENQMFNLAIILGGVQILFGMVLKAVNKIRQKGFAYSISTWSWFFLIVFSGLFYYLDEQAASQEPLLWGTAHKIILGAASLGIFVLNDPKRNIFLNIGLGFWDAYNTVIGLIGDLLSYIRLFALGLASAILGLVFNQLAFDLSPDVIILQQLVILIILVVGHSINIFMSGLGAFVHPLRLTFVEFYKNAGFTGGGKEYKPLKQLQ